MPGIAKSTAVVLMAAGIALVAGCGASRPRRPSAPEGPSARARPNLELAGRAEALKIESETLVPRGPGAEGRVGDYLLHNALTRFIVGAAHRQEPCPAYAGAVVDAALYGGREHMRLLVPQIGDGVHPTVTCERVWVEGPGGPDEAAVVVADGHCPGLEELAHFSQLLALDENHGEALACVARIHRQQARLEEAASFYERAVKARPEWAEIKRELADVYESLGQTERARELLTELGEGGRVGVGEVEQFERLKLRERMNALVTLENAMLAVMTVAFAALGLLFLSWARRTARRTKRSIADVSSSASKADRVLSKARPKDNPD